MTFRKRAFDIVVGSILAVAAIPLVAALAFGVILSLHSPPFFVQRRIGLHGRPFWLVKLRTLPRTVPASADKYAIADEVTSRFCRLLRATHLDELPQLFLVPLGTMSLVGPRPEMPELLARFDPAFVEARQRVRPGCTGLWQISPDADLLIGEAPQHDLEYLKRWSLRLDVWILARTLRPMLRPASRPNRGHRTGASSPLTAAAPPPPPSALAAPTRER
jgi:lipopolysaccharide/colanic/teichoic acid biosynthesis glycosyltransferase